MAKSTVRGYRETARAIRKLSEMRRPISESSRYALQPIQRDAKTNIATHKSNRYVPGPNIVRGNLIKAIVIRQKKVGRGQQQTVVSAYGRGVKTAHLVEFGTDPHWQPKRQRMHPGAQPFPFLTPAFVKNDDKAVKRFGEKIGPAVEAQARRVRAKVNKR